MRQEGESVKPRPASLNPICEKWTNDYNTTQSIVPLYCLDKEQPSMSQAIANPEELERFARDLKQFNGQLKESMTRLNAQFRQLGDTWRDQEHQKYGQEFEQTMRVLAQFMRASDEHIPFLLRKASRLRDYLSQR